MTTTTAPASARPSTAEVFYGTSTNASPQDSGPSTALGGDGAKGKTAERKLGEEAPSNEDVFYADSTKAAIESRIADDMVAVSAALNLSQEDSAQISKQTAAIFHDLGVPQDEVPVYFGLYRETLLNPPDEKTQRDWRIQSMRAATEMYGADEAQKRLTRVQEYLAGNPTLKDELNVTGLGSHPKVVKAFLEQAHRLKVRR